MICILLTIVAFVAAILFGGVVGFALGISYYQAKQFEEKQKIIGELFHEKQRENPRFPN